MSQGLCTPYYLFFLWYNFIYGPTMGYIITTIGSITKFIGGSVITAEAAVFNATNYMSPIYYTLKLIENIIPSIHYIPRRTHQQPTANAFSLLTHELSLSKLLELVMRLTPKMCALLHPFDPQ
jgi:hypothetical protein